MSFFFLKKWENRRVEQVMSEEVGASRRGEEAGKGMGR
jgi:hypothetical protein